MKNTIHFILALLIFFQNTVGYADESFDFSDDPVVISNGNENYDGAPDGNCVGGCSSEGSDRGESLTGNDSGSNSGAGTGSGSGDGSGYDSGDDYGRNGDQDSSLDEHHEIGSDRGDDYQAQNGFTGHADYSDANERRQILQQRQNIALSVINQNIDNIDRYQSVRYPSNCSFHPCNINKDLIPKIQNFTISKPDTSHLLAELLKGSAHSLSGYYLDQVGDFTREVLDQNPYVSSHAKELDHVRDRLKNTPAKGPQQYEAKVAAFQNLRKADNAYKIKDEESGKTYHKIAIFLADIATDFIPVISIPKDTFKAIVGIDPVTGEKLAPIQRIISGVFAGLNIATVGAATPIIASIKDIAKIAQASKEEIKIAEKINSVSKSIDPKGIVHILYGETKIIDGVEKIKSGLHNEAAVQSLLSRWEKQGVQYNVVKINHFSEFSTKPLTGNSILRYESPNGFIGYQFPVQSFLTEKIATNNVIKLQNSIIVPGGKSIFPTSWDEVKIINVLEEVKTKGTFAGERTKKYMYENINIKVVLNHNEEKIVTGYPILGE